MSRLHKAVVVFPKPAETKPFLPPQDDSQGTDYLEHLLDLADQFYRAEPADEIPPKDSTREAA